MSRLIALLAIVAMGLQTPTIASADECSCGTTVGATCGECSCGDGSCGESTCGKCGNGCGFFGDDLLTRPLLLGHLFGPKSRVVDYGITTNVILGQYYQGVTTGGNERIDAYGGKVDYYFGYGGEKSSMPHGLSLSLHAETRYGYDITSAAGGLTLPNAPLLYPLPGDYNGTNITGLMLTQSLFDEQAAMFFGKLNAVDLVTGLFPDVGGGREGFMNVNGLVSALPWLRYINLSMWGGGAWTIKKEGIGTGVIFFGTDSTATDWDFSPGFEDGVGLLGFSRYFYEIGGKPGYVMGVVGTSTKEYASNEPHDWLILPGGGPLSPVQKQPWSLAAYVSQVLWQDDCDKNRRLNFTLAGSLADSNPSFSNWNAIAKMEAFGVVSSRPGDRMGISGWYNGMADDFIDLAADVGVGVQDNWGLELYYNREITPWFHLTGDVQILENSSPADDTALVLGIRAIIDL